MFRNKERGSGMSDIMQELKKEKIVAIIRTSSSENIVQTVESLYRGGIRFVEVTLNTPGALSVIENLKALQPNLRIGAGTVLDTESAVSAIQHGAEFLLAPTLDEKSIQAANRYGVPLIPGVFTPTEALRAYEAGAKMVKVFPVRQLGPTYLKDLAGPLPFISTMAVGGLNIENISEYLEAGASSAGIGSSLVDNKLVAEGNFEAIEKRAQQFVQAAKTN